MSDRICLDAPNIGRLEKHFLGRAIDTGYISSIGPFVSEFEGKFARYLGAKRAVSTQSGTAAIHVALHELGVGKGDEVIVPALTFVASVTPILYVGAKPVFADVDPVTWNIDPRSIAGLVTRRTKAIIPVHLYGNPCDMRPIMAIARTRRLAVIEDATESLGATYRGAHTGTFGDFGCFSFNGNKVITTGGGGMLVGTNTRRMDHVKFLVNQAREESSGYYHPEVGFNYRMTNVEAALGLAQMERLAGFLARKRAFYAIYRRELGDIPHLRFQEECAGGRSSRWLTCIVFDRPVDLALLQKRLKGDAVPTRRIFMPITEFPHCKACRKGRLAATMRIYERGLCLPGSTLNSDADIRRASAAIRKRLKGAIR